MTELKSADKSVDRQAWWSMLMYKVKYAGWSRSRALAQYKEKFGVWPRGLNDSAITPDLTFEKWVKASLIRYLHRKKA
jgi:hypothetical protein